MNFKTTVFLLLFVLVVGAYLYFVSLQSPTTYDQMNQTTDTRDGIPVFRADEFSTESVNKVELRRKDQTSVVVLEKEAGDWWQSKPVRFPLNSWSADKIVDESAKLRYREKSQPGVNDFPALNELSLDPPLATIVLKGEVIGADDFTHTIYLGRRSMGRAYVKVNDDSDVYVVKNDLHKLILDDGVKELRKKRLTGPDESKADQLILSKEDGALELTKSDGQWVFAGGDSGRASREAVKDVLEAVDGTYVADFIADEPENLSLYGLDEPVTTLTIRVPAPKPAANQPAETGNADERTEAPPTMATLRIGSPKDLKKDHFFATYESNEYEGTVVFTLSKSDVEDLDKSVDDLRDKRITPISASDVTRYLIDTGATAPIDLNLKAEGWSFADPGPGYRADNEKVTERLDGIVSAEADAFEGDASPTGAPSATITLTATGRPAPDVLKIYELSDSDEQRLVIRNNETTGYLVSWEKLAAAFEPALSLRDRRAVDLEEQIIASIAITRPDGTGYVFERALIDVAVAEPEATEPATTQPVIPKAPWSLAGHEKFEQDAFESLVENLFPIKATSWIDTTEDVSGYEIELVTYDGESHTVLVNPDTRTAIASNITDARLKVSEDFVKALEAEFRDRTVLAISSDDIESIVARTGDQTLTIRKNDDGDYVSDEGEEIDDSASGALFDTVAGLRVARYVDGVDSPDASQTFEILTKDGTTHLLAVAPDTASLDGRTFTVDDDTREKLEAEMIEQEDEDKE